MILPEQLLSCEKLALDKHRLAFYLYGRRHFKWQLESLV